MRRLFREQKNDRYCRVHHLDRLDHRVFRGRQEGAKFHLNQALVIFLAGIVCSIIARITIVGAIIGGIASIVVFIFWIMGLVAACKEEEKEVPLLGKIKLLK